MKGKVNFMANINQGKGTYDPNYYQTHKDLIKKNNNKYQKKLSATTIRMKPERYDFYKQAAKDAGMSFNAFIFAALDEKSGYKT